MRGGAEGEAVNTAQYIFRKESVGKMKGIQDNDQLTTNVHNDFGRF